MPHPLSIPKVHPESHCYYWPSSGDPRLGNLVEVLSKDERQQCCAWDLLDKTFFNAESVIEEY